MKLQDKIKFLEDKIRFLEDDNYTKLNEEKLLRQEKIKNIQVWDFVIYPAKSRLVKDAIGIVIDIKSPLQRTTNIKTGETRVDKYWLSVWNISDFKNSEWIFSIGVGYTEVIAVLKNSNIIMI